MSSQNLLTALKYLDTLAVTVSEVNSTFAKVSKMVKESQASGIDITDEQLNELTAANASAEALLQKAIDNAK
ncbi:MAG: hypothetical protein FDX18_03025 [Chlorobium sp.]|nr:MAG: hypothetical protein FDX18_03025 [Chlorobium sp.]